MKYCEFELSASGKVWNSLSSAFLYFDSIWFYLMSCLELYPGHFLNQTNLSHRFFFIQNPFSSFHQCLCLFTVPLRPISEHQTHKLHLGESNSKPKLKLQPLAKYIKFRIWPIYQTLFALVNCKCKMSFITSL